MLKLICIVNGYGLCWPGYQYTVCLYDKLDTPEVEVKEVKATLQNASESINGLKAENVPLKLQVKALDKSLNASKKEYATIKERVIDIQARSMRENLIFYGIEEMENHEAGLYSEEVLKTFLKRNSKSMLQILN